MKKRYEIGREYSMHGKRNAYKILVQKLKGRDYLEKLDIDGKVVLRWISKNYCMNLWAELIWLMTESTGCCQTQ